MSLLGHDIRRAARSLARSPGLTAVAVLTIGLGVGASTTMFGALHSVVLRPLPYSEPDRIVRLFPTLKQNDRAPWTGADFVDFVDQARSYDAVAGYQYVELSLASEGLPRRVNGVSVTPAFFQVFAVPPLLGRWLAPSTDAAGGAPAVVLTHSLWQSAFAGDRGVVGRTLQLDRQIYTVAGVMPAGFAYPEGARLWVVSRYRAPENGEISDDPAHDRSNRYFHVVGRLLPGVTAALARQEGGSIMAALAATYPETNRGQGLAVVPAHEVAVASVRPLLAALFAAAGLVLLVACANVANILLARAAGSTHDVAVRTALGAGRRDIIRESLAESLLLGLLGGGLGVGLAFLGTAALRWVAESYLPRASEVAVSVPVLVFAAAASLFGGLLIGIAPALWLSRENPAAVLRNAGGRTVVGGVHSRTRAALAAAEVAISLSLLVGLGLLIRTLGVLGSIDPGFAERQAVTAQIWLSGARPMSDDELRAFHGELLARVRALPGVLSAGAVVTLPIDESVGVRTTYSFEGRVTERADQPVAALNLASPGYFESLGIPVLRGRAFTAADGPHDPPVMVVSEAFAARFFPGENAVGRRAGIGHPEENGFQWAEVVGVVGSVRSGGLDSDPRVEAYQPLAQSPSPWLSLVLRTTLPPEALAAQLRRVVAELRPTQPVERIMSMAEIVRESLARRKLHTLLLGLFAGIAVAVAAIGVYGVVSLSLARRTAEIGLRIAVGATPRDIILLLLGYGVRFLGPGLLIGAAGSLLVGRLMRGFLFGVPEIDPISVGAGVVTVVLAATAATLLPARRALRTDPSVVLRAG